MIKVKTVEKFSKKLYIFSMPDNNKTYTFTYNDNTHILLPKNGMIAVYEPGGITTDVLITYDDCTRRCTVPNN